jgi:pimeloyl-ACP methyl ester carboxylesterase
MAQEDDVGVLDWADQINGVRWIRYDARGHGQSEATYEPESYGWTELAEDMLALADALKARAPILGGVSMGCATSLHAAVAQPRRVAALVLVAPPTAWQSRARQARIYRYGAGILGWTGLAPFRLLASALPATRRNASPDGSRNESEGDSLASRMQRAVVAHLGRADEDAVVAALRGAALSDLPPLTAIAGLRMPALVLAWRRDPVHPVSSAEKLAATLPGAELHVATSLEQIRRWPETVGRFLERIEK